MKKKPTLLALETSTSACSAALLIEDRTAEQYQVGNNVHSRVLLSMVDSLLKECEVEINQLDAVVVGQGPGSFTGLRIGVGVGQGIAYGINKDMIGVPTLDAMAEAFRAKYLQNPLASQNEAELVVALDARMQEVYWASYKISANPLKRYSQINVSKPEDIHYFSSNERYTAGNGFVEYVDRFQDDITAAISQNSIELPKASFLLEPAIKKYGDGDVISPSAFLPLYVRNDVAKKPKKRSN